MYQARVTSTSKKRRFASQKEEETMIMSRVKMWLLGDERRRNNIANSQDDFNTGLESITLKARVFRLCCCDLGGTMGIWNVFQQ